jgi:hypothetical protein
MDMAKALSLEEKLAGARSLGNMGWMSAVAFIKSSYGSEAVKKFFAEVARHYSEQWKQMPGEGALKALNFSRHGFQVVGNDIKVLEESPRKVVFQATTCGPSKIGVGGPGTPLCEFCAAAVVETARALGWKATAKTGKTPCEWSISTT